MKPLSVLSLLFLLIWSIGVQARLTIEITGGTEGAQPIAIVPFAGPEGGGVLAEDVAAVIAADLARTGRFRPMPRRDMMATPHTAEEVDLRDWRLVAMDNLVIGKVERAAVGGYDVSCVLFDVFRGKQLAAMTFTSRASELRYAAHRIADMIYERLTGSPGVAATRIAYVTSDGNRGGQRIKLEVADADGHNPQTIVSSRDPIMSPAWSPNGRQLAYVSFENRRTAIYLQEMATGRRERIAGFKGINGSPAWSPDGRSLAMTLSKGGNPDIYVLDLVSRNLRQVTDHFAIDTEPAWSPDGRHIIFTSNRGGSPQIYRIPATGGTAARVTFENDYNGRASYAPDGRSILCVTRIDGSFRIGLLDLNTGTMRSLSSGRLDESPSFAPNGTMVIYATLHGGRSILSAVSVDGSVSQRLSQGLSDVREPAWSPLLR
ncbi:Tol-Pal system beta propeller repeat protein TolB [Candidatus Thiosymbion oneisti]|uniref:Tol-Pal system beta propeller repeat protein TolB n=1 Tax=Candidatus Thiosymbion oneisti TaxID=589554 RepID=UPI000A8CC740|nr:Tol-Pal system beta propeller repeat protein TolB [Candidatus Thiosymbion oneisti]